MIRSEKFKLAKAEKLNMINMRPSNQAEAYAVLSFTFSFFGLWNFVLFFVVINFWK